MGICNTLKQTIRKIPLSVPPLGMNNESTLKRNLKVVCGFWYHLCKKFINNVGLKPLYFRGQRSRRYQCFCLRPCYFDTLRARYNENVRYDKELTENEMIRQKDSTATHGVDWVQSWAPYFNRRYRTEIWLQQTQHPASVPKFHACAFGRIHSQTKALSCRHSCPAHREIYAWYCTLFAFWFTAVIQPRI